MAELYVKGCADYQALPVADRVRFGSLVSEHLLAWNLRYLHVRGGLQDADTWERQKALLVAVVTQPGVRDWWKRNRPMFDSAFVGAVEEMIANARNESASPQQGAAAGTAGSPS